MKRLGMLMLGILLVCLTPSQSGAGAGVAPAPQAAPLDISDGHWAFERFQHSGAFNSIAVDSDDLVHISYSTGAYLKYTHQIRLGDATWWATETAAIGEFQDTSLALDENDRPAISYYHATNQNLGWAWSPTAGVWLTGSRDTPAMVDGKSTSAVYRNDRLHIASLNPTTSDVEFIQIEPGGAWPPAPEIVGGDHAGDKLSLALRSDDLPRVSYYDDLHDRLMYARRTESGWEQDILDGDVEHKRGECNSLALNSENPPRIAYYDATDQDLRYISYLSLIMDWGAPAMVDDSLGGPICYTSLAVDGAGAAHILYYDGHTPGSLRYARWQDGLGWQIERVDGPADSCGMHSALALDSSDRPHAVYFCAGELVYAYRLSTLYLPLIVRGQ